MMRAPVHLVATLLALSLTLASAGASAQMYKWVDQKGSVHYTDTPPPPNARKADIKASASTVQNATVPYALAQAMRSHPVILYTAPGCKPCDQGRSLLKARGVPFAEKLVTSEADVARLRAAGGNGDVPFLLVGKVSSSGFDSASWTGALTTAGYPLLSVLPRNYQFAAPEAAAPAPAAAAEVHPRVEAEVAAGTAATRPASPPPNNNRKADTPPGFQF